MNKKIQVEVAQLTKERFEEAADVVLKAELDTREEIEHHLAQTAAHYIALDKGKIIGVIGWYQDNVNYANEAMGDDFPGEEAYWVGFFAVDEKYRGKGVGYALLTKLEDILKEKAVKELWVSSVPQSKEYYKREGFKEIKEGNIQGKPHVFLKKDLLN